MSHIIHIKCVLLPKYLHFCPNLVSSIFSHHPWVYWLRSVSRAQGFYGAGYLISFSCGAMIVTIAMWILRYLFCLYRARGDTKQAYDSLPSFHFKEMWLQGFLAGSLYSLGNFCTLITVSILGWVYSRFCQKWTTWGILYVAILYSFSNLAYASASL